MRWTTGLQCETFPDLHDSSTEALRRCQRRYLDRVQTRSLFELQFHSDSMYDRPKLNHPFVRCQPLYAG